jgi:hypothetical protein
MRGSKQLKAFVRRYSALHRGKLKPPIAMKPKKFKTPKKKREQNKAYYHAHPDKWKLIYRPSQKAEEKPEDAVGKKIVRNAKKHPCWKRPPPHKQAPTPTPVALTAGSGKIAPRAPTAADAETRRIGAKAYRDAHAGRWRKGGIYYEKRKKQGAPTTTPPAPPSPPPPITPLAQAPAPAPITLTPKKVFYELKPPAIKPPDLTAPVASTAHQNSIWRFKANACPTTPRRQRHRQPEPPPDPFADFTKREPTASYIGLKKQWEAKYLLGSS